MNNPWGISGPQFLWLYVAGFVVAGVAAIVLRRRGRFSAAAATGNGPLTVDESAYLSGGWQRMVESAIAALVERNTLRVERSGRLYPVTDAHNRPKSTLEELIVGHVRQRPGRTVLQLQRQLAQNAVFEQVHVSLAARGLLHVSGRAFLSALPLIVLAVIGVVRWINGVNLGYPVGYLTALLLLTVIAIVFALRPATTPVPTKAGERMLSEIPAAGAAALVARGGLTAFPDRTTAKAFRARRTAGSADSGGAFYYGTAASCGGSASSSGSSSSCGGGGGGCGGGGS